MWIVPLREANSSTRANALTVGATGGLLRTALNMNNFLVLIAVLTPALWAIEFPQTVSVTAIGMVLNNSDEPAQTRQRSLIEAQRMAVEKAIGTVVKAQSLVSKSILVESTINTRTIGRIRRFEILHQGVDGIWMKTKITADVDLADPSDNHPSLDEQLAHLSPTKMFGILTFVNGTIPSDSELKEALQNPLPSLQAFYTKLKPEVNRTVPTTLLVESIAKQFGLDTDHLNLRELENLLTSGGQHE